MAMEMQEITDIKCCDNLLYRCRLRACERAPEEYTARFGTFFEAVVLSLSEVAEHCTRKVQTLICDGIDVTRMKEALLMGGAKGGDRIMPVGSALELERIWDGQDVLRCLSREITG